MLERVGMVGDAANTRKHALSCKGLVYRAGERRLIDAIDLEFLPGGITTIAGYNGAGKSLLLRLLHGLLEPSGGNVLWDGIPLSAETRRRQAMVFQKPVVLRRTVFDNLRFALASRGIHSKNQAMEALARVGLSGLEQRPARLLSGGEKQRLALCQAIACQPDVLLLDEATASLDPASVATIEQTVLAASAEGTKIIMVTHDVGQARRLSDEIVFLHHGRVLEQAPAAAFFANPKTRPAAAYLEGRLP
ncbi:ATP-binding cassette domain-containing protein [Salaquimonas pukyongi]|uniref:ATP-binding cassette domain-containing protein n=1 Tax=Salaquimonas pukyongi TaxID=2712698 RepID=UPI001FCDCD51|nr:ATP-binding cassette domain-containing protein [Salaquimonas pukyongi]